MKKTVAIIINTTWNIYNFRLGLIKALQKEGYNVVAISPTDSYVEKLEAIGCKHYDIKINNKGTNPFEDLKLVNSYFSLFKKISPDIILAYTIKPNIYGSLAAKMLNIPVISNISGLGTVFLSKKLSSKVARGLYRFALKIPKKVFFQNKCDKSLFIRLKLVKESRTGLLPGSGVNIEDFKPIDIVRDDKKIKFLFVARLVKDKGLMEYVEAAKAIKERYDNVEFAVLGQFYRNNPTAITTKQMQEWTDSGLINYLGVSDSVKSVVAQYDCVVLPSYREGLSRVLLEATAMAKPIVTTNTPGCRDVVEDGKNGFLCKVKNSQDLADKIEKFISLDAKEKLEMGKRGREKAVEEFSERLVISKYFQAIEEIENNSKPNVQKDLNQPIYAHNLHN